MTGLLVWLLVSASGAGAPARTRAGSGPPSAPPTPTFDASAFFVPPSAASALQQALASHGQVRLAANADYTPNCTTDRATRKRSCSFPEANITVGSGQAIWGLGGTVVPGLVVEPGAQGVILSTLRTHLLLFPGAAQATTRYSSFHRIQGAHVRFERGSSVADCSFVGLTELGVPNTPPRPSWHSTEFKEGGIHAAVGSTVLNNKFIRTMVHAPWPLLTVDTKSWRGNTLLWSNILGSLQTSYRASDAAEFTLVGADMETYGACWVAPAIVAERVGVTRLFGTHGRLECHPQPNASVAIATAAFALDTQLLMLSNPLSMPLSRQYNNEPPFTPSADLELGPSLQNSIWIDRQTDAPWTVKDQSERSKLELRVRHNASISLGGKPLPSSTTALPAETQAALADVVGGGDSRQAWAVAREPTPLGPLPPFAPHGQDDTKKLQGMIDAMVTSAEPKIVEAGVYYISKPLRVGALPDPAGNSTRCLAQTNKRMLVGAGRDEVVIYALTPSMVMVTSDGCWPAGQLPSASSKSFTENSRFDVSGVTLAGGAVGFRKPPAPNFAPSLDPFLEASKLLRRLQRGNGASADHRVGRLGRRL